MANKIADARRSVIRAKEAAKKRLQEIESERHEIKTSLKSLDAALKALDGRSGQTQRSGGRASLDDSKHDATNDSI